MPSYVRSHGKGFYLAFNLVTVVLDSLPYHQSTQVPGEHSLPRQAVLYGAREVGGGMRYCGWVNAGQQPALPGQLGSARVGFDPHSQVRASFCFKSSAQRGLLCHWRPSEPSHSNTSLRSPEFPPVPLFSKPHAIHPGVLRGQRAKSGWRHGWDPIDHEYAVTASVAGAVMSPSQSQSRRFCGMDLV